MADFCKDCSEIMFGKDFRETVLADAGPTNRVLCEGCGETLVNPDGECLIHTHAEHLEFLRIPNSHTIIERLVDAHPVRQIVLTLLALLAIASLGAAIMLLIVFSGALS